MAEKGPQKGEMEAWRGNFWAGGEAEQGMDVGTGSVEQAYPPPPQAVWTFSCYLTGIE